MRHLNKQVRGQKSAVIEVKLADAQQAKLLRAEFVKKFNVFGKKINITPVVRLATRVRIEIMHSVCFYLKRNDPTITKASCLQFVPKPVIKVTRKTAGGTETSRTMTFADSINWVKENGLMDSIDLSKARTGLAPPSEEPCSNTLCCWTNQTIAFRPVGAESNLIIHSLILFLCILFSIRINKA